MISPLYIDPGTGSALFTIIVSTVAALYFLAGTLWIRLRSLGSKSIKRAKNKYIIYGEDKRYFSLFEPILDEFENREIAVIYLTSSEDDPAFSKKYEFVKSEFIGKGNRAFARLNYLSADIVLATTPSLDIYQWKRSKSVKHYSHILHTSGGISRCRHFGFDYYDSILLTGVAETAEVRELENLRELPQKEMVAVGCAYLDTYLKKLECINIEKNGKTCVLVSPSWGKAGLLAVCGEELLDNLCNLDYKIIVRPHPQSKTADKEILGRLTEKYKNAVDVEWDYNPDNIFSLVKADIMISDFSGIIADYAFLLDRPVLYMGDSMDLKYYDAYWLKNRPVYLKMLSTIAKKLDKNDISRIGEIIEETVCDKDMSVLRAKAREMFWVNRGKAGKFTVDFMVNKVLQMSKPDSSGQLYTEDLAAK